MQQTAWMQCPCSKHQGTAHLPLFQCKPVYEARGGQGQGLPAVLLDATAAGSLGKQQGVALGKGPEGLAGGEACEDGQPPERRQVSKGLQSSAMCLTNRHSITALR